MKSKLSILCISFLANIALVEASSVCGTAFDKALPKAVVLESKGTENSIKIKLEDKGSGLLAFSIKHYSDAKEYHTETISYFKSDFFVESLTKIPKLTGHAPLFKGLPKTKVITLNQTELRGMSDIQIRVMDGCGYLSKVLTNVKNKNNNKLITKVHERKTKI